MQRNCGAVRDLQAGDCRFGLVMAPEDLGGRLGESWEKGDRGSFNVKQLASGAEE